MYTPVGLLGISLFRVCAPFARRTSALRSFFKKKEVFKHTINDEQTKKKLQTLRQKGEK